MGAYEWSLGKADFIHIASLAITASFWIANKKRMKKQIVYAHLEWFVLWWLDGEKENKKKGGGSETYSEPLRNFSFDNRS